MHHRSLVGSTRARSTVRTLSQHEELPLLRDHLLRLDRAGRHDRFHGFIDDSFIDGYAEKCANDGTIVIAYFEDGVVRGAAKCIRRRNRQTACRRSHLAWRLRRGGVASAASCSGS